MRKFISLFFCVLFISVLSSFALYGCTSSAIPSTEISDSIPLPTFSSPAGLYSNKFSLEITGFDGYTIRYTLDGTEPNAKSKVYKKPILIENRSKEPNDLSTITGIATLEDFVPSEPVAKGTVVRAALFSDDGKRSKTVTSTYFVGLNYDNTLVVSIVADEDGLFSYKNGIFVLGKRFDDWKEEVGDDFSTYGDWEYQGNFSLKGDDWEREINIEFFEDNKLLHEQTAGMRVSGAATRTYRQKSLRITARKQYGESRFNFDLLHSNYKDGFPDSKVESYRSFVLRNGGNDFDFAKIRDPFIQKSVEQCSFATQNTRPAVVFINGEYWGVYTVTEDYNERYIEENYGVDKDNVAMMKVGVIEEGDEYNSHLFYDVHDFIANSDMSMESNYVAACHMLDMENFAQYCAVQLYIGNEDGPFHNNNWRVWRAVKTSDLPYHDGKLRFMLYDTEYSLGIYNSGENFYDNPFNILQSHKSFCGDMLDSLIKSPQFRDLFVQELLKMRNEIFEPKNANNLISSFRGEYINLMTDHYERFGPSWVVESTPDLKGHFRWATERISLYLKGRYNYIPRALCVYLGLDPDTSIITAPDGSVSIVY